MDRKDVKKIRATNALAQKVGSGEIDEKRIEAAQKLVDANEIDFAEMAKPFLDQLQNAIKAAKKAGAGGDRGELLNGITFPIMNLKANAATFNYHVVGDVADTVMNFLDTVNTIDNEILVIADNLHKAITVVVMQKMSEKNPPGSMQLTGEFRDVCKRYMDKRMGGG